MDVNNFSVILIVAKLWPIEALSKVAANPVHRKAEEEARKK